ncbi:MAG: M20 family metallo-hydrolase [Archaeoglobaceae archaeon]|nr:M20 family metallo-hydrolase [Archaeoglobaceae archaeon]MCX8151671.1 M20 family metallo-hydrolase [Archaeoglobaceae archaeon]MDW8013051.1 M20 family metallo-hydrolase [Archaeoglobaceae archaeon]
MNEYKKDMIKMLCDLIEIKAVSPDFEGEGEVEKADYLMKKLDFFDLIQRYDYKDERAKDGVRPNIVAKIKGVLNRTIWIITHLDVVPAGNKNLWKYDPFKANIEGNKIYGRGAEDNGQAIVSSFYAAKAIHESKKLPKFSFGLVFVSDEESGNEYGIKKLVKERIFSKDDMFLVPDVSSPKGDAIEIAEKSVLWLKITVHGDQMHGSRPLGINASRRAMKIVLDLDEKLHNKFSARNYLFDLPYSTFEPTKREKNVDNINTIPGVDVSYMDCRILPNYDLQEVLDYIENIRRFYEMRDGKRVDIEVVHRSSSPQTPENVEIVNRLKKLLIEVRKVEPRLIGIGGNTCAAVLRSERFLDTVAWFTADGTAHKPNEYCIIQNMVEDAKIFYLLPFEPLR